MRACEKACIANVGGKCAVQDCRGPITMLDGKPVSDLEKAANFYEFSREAFDKYFDCKNRRAGEEGEHEAD